MVTEIVINADGLILGRLAAYCAKAALSGNSVEVINIEKAIISGNPVRIVKVYIKRRGMTNHADPEHAAKYPRRPDFLFKKILSGMLPATSRGKVALKRVKAYIGDNGKANAIRPVKDSTALRNKFISLGEICKKLGWHTRG